MNKKIIIIGAGIAGLSAGCYLRMNGYHVLHPMGFDSFATLSSGCRARMLSWKSPKWPQARATRPMA